MQTVAASQKRRKKKEIRKRSRRDAAEGEGEEDKRQKMGRTEGVGGMQEVRGRGGRGVELDMPHLIKVFLQWPLEAGKGRGEGAVMRPGKRRGNLGEREVVKCGDKGNKKRRKDVTE